jgi:hypothetical protein
MTAWEWAAIALWCLKNAFQPRGNTSLTGKSYEAPWEAGTLAPGSSSIILTGSGPASWRHDGTFAGIADLVGNEWEWNDGIKTIDGRLYFPADNTFTLPESQWPASSIYLDATTGPGDREGRAESGNIVISDRITKFTETPTPPGGGDAGMFDFAANGGEAGWRNTSVAAAYDGLPLEARQRAAQLLIAPKLTSDGSLLFPEAKGAVWAQNYGERMISRGGTAYSGSGYSRAGLASSQAIQSKDAGASRLIRPAFIL